MEDDRFKTITQDPRFKRMPKAERKVKIDRRFEGMFKDKQFKLKYSVDKRGRPIKATTDDNLRRFYDMSESDDESSGDEHAKKPKKKSNKGKGELGSQRNLNADKKSRTKITNSKSASSKDKLVSVTKRGHSKPEESKSRTIEVGSKLKSVKKQKKLPSKSERTVKEGKSKKLGIKSTTSIQKKKLPTPTSSDSEEDKLHDEESSDDSSQEDNEDEENRHSSASSSDDDSDSEDDDSTHPVIPGPDLMRGEGNIASSSSSDSSSSDDDSEDVDKDELEHGWGELDKDARRDDTVTSRLALCNMDWDRVKAQDILVLLSSFAPTGGLIRSVTIYPSEYGKERMAEEDVKGPMEMLDQDAKQEEKTDMGEEGDHFQRERLRKYQLQRLKYYYGVIECDSQPTANTIYEQCDRLEYQSSSTILDLRFIPEEMAFEDEPKDKATEMPDAGLYKPAEFRTTALHQSKVELTWDETDHIREKTTSEVFGNKDLEEADVKAYLATSSGEEDNATVPAFEIEEDDFGEAEDVDDDEGQISKYRSLLQGIDEKEKEEQEEKDTGVEISWEPGLKDTAEELVKKKMETDAQLTPWEKFMEKKKEKKRTKRAEKKQGKKEVDAENQQEDQAAFSDDDLPEGMDMEDSFFKDSLKEQNGMTKAAGKKKGKKKKQESLTAEELEEQKQKKAELELLMMDEGDDKEHFNLKDIMENEKLSTRKKRKRKRQEKEATKQEDNFQIDVKDPRFDAVYTSHLYSIDPSASAYKKTKSMDALIGEKQKRRAKNDWVNKTEEKKSHQDSIKQEIKTNVKKDKELSMLVKSIKNKTQQFNERKSKKDFGR